MSKRRKPDPLPYWATDDKRDWEFYLRKFLSQFNIDINIDSDNDLFLEENTNFENLK